MSILLALTATLPGPLVPDPELAAMRGGFRLPSGIDVALAVQTQTAIDGAIVLRSVFAADKGQPTLAVYAPSPGTVVSAEQEARATSGDAGMPRVTIDADGRPAVITAAPALAVAIGTRTGAAPVPEGLTQVPGSGTSSDAGRISQASDGALMTARLDGPDLSVVHFAGRAFGSLIANMGNDRAIETTTTVSIDLRDAGPDLLGSSAFRVERVALDALAARGL